MEMSSSLVLWFLLKRKTGQLDGPITRQLQSMSIFKINHGQTPKLGEILVKLTYFDSILKYFILSDVNFKPQWNQLDGKVDRRSHVIKKYLIDKNGYPLNPTGRTGVNLRGVLGRWGECEQ